MTKKMIVCAILQMILLLQALPVEAGEYCKYSYSSYYSSYSSRYCANGCCGGTYSDYSDVCCSEIITLEGGAIAGIVLGSLAALGILISLIACCCAAANNSSRRTGVVMQPANTGMQTLVVNNTAFSQGQSMIPGPQGTVGNGYPIGVQPPPYAQHNNVSHGSANPANAPPPAQY